MDVRDASVEQRFIDGLFRTDRSRGVIADMMADSMIAADIENGVDPGEAISRQRFWDDLLE